MQRDANALRKLLDAMRGCSAALLGHQRCGVNARDLVLLAALGTGPMTPYKLAIYCGVPRPTAVRRLAHLEAKGLWCSDGAGGAYTLTREAVRRLDAG